MITKLSVYAILTGELGQFLLQKRANSSFANGFWSLPGGHVESSESLLKALQRELLEELNIKVKIEDCHFRLTLVRKPQEQVRYVNFFYCINVWEGTPVITDDKASELGFFSLLDLPSPTLDYIHEALNLIKQDINFHESNY